MKITINLSRPLLVMLLVTAALGCVEPPEHGAGEASAASIEEASDAQTLGAPRATVTTCLPPKTLTGAAGGLCTGEILPKEENSLCCSGFSRFRCFGDTMEEVCL